jgi:CheY-like chemotaxis protein
MASQHPQLNGRRVLIVEDELVVVMEVEDLLEEQGCELLRSASSVPEALARIRGDRPQLVILDRNLAGVRTSEVARELNDAGIPYIVMTGYSQGTADEPLMAAAPCIKKPWNPTELLQWLTQLVDEGPQ